MRRNFIILRVFFVSAGNLLSQEAHALRLFANRVLWQTFVPRKEEVREDWRKYYNEGFMVCSSDQILLGG
jgi:hypothetical protein